MAAFEYLAKIHLPTRRNAADEAKRQVLFDRIVGDRDPPFMSYKDAVRLCLELGMFEILDVTPIVRSAFKSCHFIASSVADGSSDSLERTQSVRLPPEVCGRDDDDDEPILPPSGFRLFLEYLQLMFNVNLIFGNVDITNDKLISFSELAIAVKPLAKAGIVVRDVKATFRDMDADQSGEVSFPEFADWIIRKKLADDLMNVV